MESTFDANERVAGFSLLSIKKVLQSVGIMDDRDDIENVASGLKCGRNQAERVLEELEQKGFVTKTSNPRQWKTTRRGHELGFSWKPPRRFRPVIERESGRAINIGFEQAPCLILRTSPDEDVFEEACIDAGMNVEFEGDQLVGINLIQPDDYDDPDGSASIATSLYLSPVAAKTLMESLGKAVEEAEREIARRRRIDERRAQRAKERWEKKAEKKTRKSANSKATVREIPSPPRKPKRLPVHEPPSELPALPVAEDIEATKRRAAVSASLEELRKVNRSRRTKS